MSTLKQSLVEYSNTINKAKGTSNSANLRKAFPSSPIYSGEISDIERLNFYQDEVMDATNVAGKGVTNYDMNFNNGVPNLEDVETGGGGKPATPFSPNITSPGPGNANAANQPEFDGIIKDPETVNNFGTGLGGLVSPSKTAKNISSIKIGQYISGRSYKGSDGRS